MHRHEILYPGLSVSIQSPTAAGFFGCAIVSFQRMLLRCTHQIETNFIFCPSGRGQNLKVHCTSLKIFTQPPELEACQKNHRFFLIIGLSMYEK